VVSLCPSAVAIGVRAAEDCISSGASVTDAEFGGSIFTVVHVPLVTYKKTCPKLRQSEICHSHLFSLIIHVDISGSFSFSFALCPRRIVLGSNVKGLAAFGAAAAQNNCKSLARHCKKMIYIFGLNFNINKY
jgi:hypothetical protein